MYKLANLPSMHSDPFHPSTSRLFDVDDACILSVASTYSRPILLIHTHTHHGYPPIHSFLDWAMAILASPNPQIDPYVSYHHCHVDQKYSQTVKACPSISARIMQVVILLRPDPSPVGTNVVSIPSSKQTACCSPLNRSSSTSSALPNARDKSDLGFIGSWSDRPLSGVNFSRTQREAVS